MGDSRCFIGVQLTGLIDTRLSPNYDQLYAKAIHLIRQHESYGSMQLMCRPSYFTTSSSLSSHPPSITSMNITTSFLIPPMASGFRPQPSIRTCARRSALPLMSTVSTVSALSSLISLTSRVNSTPPAYLFKIDINYLTDSVIVTYLLFSYNK